MYKYVKDKKFLKRMRMVCSDLINQLVQQINKEGVLFVESNLIGSGAKNLETQNENEPIDLDYNLVILDAISVDINDCKSIKECVRKTFNKILKKNGWGDCKDSTSALTTEKRRFNDGNQTLFSIDLAIIGEDANGWYRLIHDKQQSRYYWNMGQNTKNLLSKVERIKETGKWEKVRTSYLCKKNMYLSRGDKQHPSFNCYIEAVNEVYYTI